MRKTFLVALAGLAIGAGIAVPTAASANSEERQNRRCAQEFHAAVVEDNEAYNSRDEARYERILNPRMIFWADGVATYGRDPIMANARAAFAVPGWVWLYEIKSETVYGCDSGIAVLEAHVNYPETGKDIHYEVTMGLVKEHGRWSVAIDNVHRVSPPAPPA
jgi:hypothetical protein